MADIISDKKSWTERLSDSYKIVVMDEEDLREVNSYSVSLRRIYFFVLLTVGIITMLTVSAIVFTPIKRLIPGYGKLENDAAYQELFTKIDELEQKLKAQDIYTIGLQNMLKGMEEGKGNASVPIESLNFKAEDIKETDRTGALSRVLLSSPISGTISNDFDPVSEHYGIDVLAPKNTPIKSIQDGVVINAGWSAETGNVVYIQHPKNIVSVYKHNSSILVKTGQRVATGQAIAIIGNTGTLSSGPHLHFELWYDGIPVNPVNYISF